MIDVKPLAPFGARIEGIDLATDDTPATQRRVIGALYQHRFVVIPGQVLTPAQFLRFGRAFGTPIPHVLDHLRLPGWPDILPITNDRAHARSTADADRNGAAFWHTDQSYEAEPASSTMLYAIMAPDRGGQTLIADMRAAYDALPEAMKERIDPLVVRHLYGSRDAGRDGETEAAPLINDAQVAHVPPVLHALVRRHPVTGRKALYALTGTARGIRGMAEGAARALLGELKAHALQDRFIYSHHYRPGDVAIWDTCATLHSATPIAWASDIRDTRFLHRISVRGRPPVLAP